MDPDTDADSDGNQAASEDMATGMVLLRPRLKGVKDKRDRLTVLQVEPYTRRNLTSFLDSVLECQRNQIVVEILQRESADAESRLQQIEARIDVVALAHVPEIEDPIDRLLSIASRLPELGEAELLDQWASIRDEIRNLDGLHEQQEQLMQASRQYVDAAVQRLIDDRVDIASVRAVQRLRGVFGLNVNVTTLARPNAASSVGPPDDTDPPIADRDRSATRYYEADYQLQKARFEHDGLRVKTGDRYDEWQRRRAETVDSDERDAVWREITATAIENLRRAEIEWSEAAQEAYDNHIDANPHHTSIFSHSSHDTISEHDFDEAQEAKDAERAADPRISFRAAWHGRDLQWVERRPVCDWTKELPAQGSSVYNPVDVGTERFQDGDNLWRPWGEHKAIQPAVSNVEGGSESGLELNLLPRLKRPMIGEGDDWGRQLKKHRKIAKYTAAMQEKCGAFESTEPVFLPRGVPSTSEFLGSDTNSTEVVPLSEVELDARGADDPSDEGIQEPVSGETQDLPGPSTGPQDSPPAVSRNGISKSELADMKTNTIITGSRSTRSGKNCNWPQLQEDEWARAQRARDGQ